MTTPRLTDDEIEHFLRRYEHCPECKGWDEFYDNIQTPRRSMNGTILETEPRPTGLTVKGRSNHRRACTRKAA